MRMWLKLLRVGADMSQLEIAEKMGISRTYYGMIEIGKRKKSLDLPIVKKLSELFGVTVDWIAEQEKNLQTKEGDNIGSRI